MARISAGTVHISNVSDNKVDKLEKHYKAGRSKVECRVTGFSWLDGLVTLTMKPSALATQVMVYEDVAAGAELLVKVVKLTDKGCIVAVRLPSSRPALPPCPCVFILLYMRPRTTVHVSAYCYMCPHTAIYLSS
jgi:hypothetical protein